MRDIGDKSLWPNLIKTLFPKINAVKVIFHIPGLTIIAVDKRIKVSEMLQRILAVISKLLFREQDSPNWHKSQTGRLIGLIFCSFGFFHIPSMRDVWDMAVP